MKKFFEKFSGVYAVLSEREDGSMKMLGDGGNEENRNSFFEKNGINPNNVVSAYLENKTNVEIIEDNNLKVISSVDGLITNNNISLAITVADCIPVFFFESEKRIIAIAHAGWRGVVGDIVPKTIEKIKKLEGKAENIKIALGPGINNCHFEIKKDVLSYFEKYNEFIIKRDAKIFIDLKGILKEQLKNNGVSLENIENDNECTFESEKYFSYRRDNPEVIEAMMAVIGFKK